MAPTASDLSCPDGSSSPTCHWISNNRSMRICRHEAQPQLTENRECSLRFVPTGASCHECPDEIRAAEDTFDPKNSRAQGRRHGAVALPGGKPAARMRD